MTTKIFRYNYSVQIDGVQYLYSVRTYCIYCTVQYSPVLRKLMTVGSIKWPLTVTSRNIKVVSEWLTYWSFVTEPYQAWKMSSFLTQDKENVSSNSNADRSSNIVIVNSKDRRDKVTNTISTTTTTTDDITSSTSTPHKHPYSPPSSKPQNPNVVRLLSLKKSMRCLSDADILSIAVESSVRKTQEKLRLNAMHDTQEVCA